ncbi:Prefoldin [Catenaria anguillulae PL171]|uniref:Prefoldin n=1 Tax=Catenaria anguillulae PL171 TaxID=765915 RepID=A0A1Y2HU00_9FUNG|nr:Prefoldin [Catenaria anguillulae PL171]
MEKKFEADVKAFETMNKEYTTLVSNRQTLESQLKENELVQKEFELLDDEATVYKLIGPVLVKQEQPEAKANVKKRLEFIRGEIDRAEKSIKDLSAKMDKTKMELMAMQSEIQKRKNPSA